MHLLFEYTKDMEINLQTPLKKNMKDTRSKAYVKSLMKIRRRIETTIGQFAERFEIEKCRRRDTWHLTSRIARKLLGITASAYLNIKNNKAPMQFVHLVKC